MEKIKFRAWDNTRKRICKVKAIDWDCNDEIVSAHLEYNGEVYKVYPSEYCDDIVFMQYTNQLDDKGKEIYEYDKVKIIGHDYGEGWFNTREHDYNFTTAVKWNKRKNAFMCGGYHIRDVDWLEVVGNIYEEIEI